MSDIILLKALKRLRDEGPFHKHYGICSNLDVYSYFSQDELNELFKKWPEFSGNVGYPVPYKDLEPHEVYDHHKMNNTMWVGEYGETRKRLLNFMIEELEKKEKEKENTK